MNKALCGPILISFATLTMALPAAAARTRNIRGETVGQILRSIQKQSLTKSSVALPQTQRMQAMRSVPRDLWDVKPPKSSDFYRNDSSSDQIQLEKITDEQISRLYRLTQQFRRSPNRGELWLRLAELYSEKARLVEFRRQREYDKRIALYEQRKTKVKPRLDLRAADLYTSKAIVLYTWFIKDFPQDEKVDQALFFLGYNNVELGHVKEGIGYYKELTSKYPSSPYVSESQFALGEYYFENEHWKDAYHRYMQVVAHRSARLYDFALYKAAWCLFRVGKSSKGLKYLEIVIRHGRSQVQEAHLEGRKEVNGIRLAQEAKKDLVPFYADAGSYKEAESYFLNVTGSQSDTDRLLEGLAYNYAAAGRRDESAFLFRNLINKAPQSPKAFDFQYQIVLNYVNVQNREFQHELYVWISNFGPNSQWWSANSSNSSLIENSYALQETTLRNYVLQRHQTEQNSRSLASQRDAYAGYLLYFQSFPNSKQVSQMHFFFGELLFDMKKWNEAATQYTWVVQNAPHSPYYEKASMNTLLALENTLPDEMSVRKRLGDNVQPQPLTPEIARFAQAARDYVAHFPRSDKTVEIEFRLGRLYFTYNHFDEALQIFNHVLKSYPRTTYAQYSAGLIMDIYDLRKDDSGLARVGRQLLQNPQIANSSAGAEIRTVVERAGFKTGQDLEVAKKYAESARTFEAFARANPRSALATDAQYDSGINYERSGDLSSALRMYAVVLATRDAKSASLRNRTRKLYANVAFQMGRLREAAQEFETYANQNPRDKEVGNFYYNAALIYDGFNMRDAAIRNYQRFYKVRQSPDYKQSYFYIAEMQRRMGSLHAAIAAYRQYLDTSPTDISKKMEASYRLAQLNEQVGKPAKADHWYNQTIKVYKVNMGDAGIKPRWAAESRLKLALKTLDNLKSIRIPKNPKRQQAAVQQKLALVNRLNSQMADVIRFSYGPTIVGAFASIGEAYDHMADAISQVPAPSGLSADELKQYKAGVDKIVAPMRAKAIENYKSAIARSSQLESYGDWTLVAIKGLRHDSPKDVVSHGEKAMDAQSLDWMNL